MLSDNVWVMVYSADACWRIAIEFGELAACVLQPQRSPWRIRQVDDAYTYISESPVMDQIIRAIAESYGGREVPRDVRRRILSRAEKGSSNALALRSHAKALLP